MTARELLLKQIAEAENQLLQAIGGLDAEHAEARANAEGMTIREMVAHLAETSHAVLLSYEGKAHDFGSWTPEDRSWTGVKATWKELRGQAVARLPEGDETLLSASGFLVEHDFYHVGQIVAARLTVHPEWDAFVIYQPAY